MIIGIGCDIVEHETTSKLGWDKKLDKLDRIFTLRELTQINPKQKIRFLSGRFAAKEAVLKSLGTAMEDGISLTDIQIFRENNGKPIVKLTGNIRKIAQRLGVKYIQLSISHSTQYSLAFAIAEGL